MGKPECQDPASDASFKSINMRWKSYISCIALILGLRFLDLYLTFRYTPNLTQEWNPLVSIFGASWSGFIFMQIMVVLFVFSLMYFYFNRKMTVPSIQNLSFSDFIYVYFFDRLKPWPGRMISYPIHWSRHLVFNGFVFMVMTILISGFAIVHNLLLIHSIESYARFVAGHYKIYFPACFVLSGILSAHTFFMPGYLNYRRSQNRI